MSFLDEIRKIPPVTRFLCLATVGVSVPVMAKIVSPYAVLFVREYVTQYYQLWRVPTSFFLASSGINFIFDIAMLYRTSNQLEEGEYRSRSPDYAWQLFLACLSIVALNMPLGTFVHTRPMIHALTYLSCALAPPGSLTSLFGIISIPVAYFPYAMIGLDAMMGGQSAAAQAVSGALVGHAWWWGVFHTRALEVAGTAPGWVRAFIAAGAAPPPVEDQPPAFGTRASGFEAIPPRQRAQPSANTGGYKWGSGSRLGTD